MIILNKENMVSYLRKYAPSIVLMDPVSVAMIGEGELGKDVEGDGYCNYVYRVSDSTHSYIVKQSQEHLRRRGKPMDPRRNEREYEIMKLRSEIVPQYVPKLYGVDLENHVFIMEDVSNLKLIRYQLSENHLFPELARQGAHYLAATHFYTSEFYLSSADYRELISKFMNAEMRVIMENGIFLQIFGSDNYDPACGPEFEAFCKKVRFDDRLLLQRYRLRHLFMSKSETLIHGDFHTSNIFADDNNLKVIDMEYTFGGPFSYDLGFIIANLIIQLCSAVFRPFESGYLRQRFVSYILSMIQSFYTDYIRFFFRFWEKDAKLEYRITEGYKETIALDILRECFGFAACVNFSRAIGYMETEDFDCIEDNGLRTKAKFLSVDIDRVLFEKWDSYNHISEIISDIIELISIHTSK